MTSAIGCLDAADVPDMSTYALALAAYAYTLYESTASARRQHLLDELDTRARWEGQFFKVMGVLEITILIS